MILFIDNYDSFTYNLVDILGQYESNLLVFRNDKITIDRIVQLKPVGIILSPGPGIPREAGICCELIKNLYRDIPILGVCLGHQCIGEVFGARIIRTKKPLHGKTSNIIHKETDLFRDIPSPFPATRYHSLIIERRSLPSDLDIIAETEDGFIMAIQHHTYPLIGVQFHPESILTQNGSTLIYNWLNMIKNFLKETTRKRA